MSCYEYILLDLDGTVADSAEGVLNSVRHTLKTIGLPIPPYQKLKGFIGPPLSVGFTDICGVTAEEAEICIKHYREYYRAGGLFEYSIYDGIEEVLYRLSSAGKKLVLATSKPEEFAFKIIEHSGLLKYFHTVAGASFDNSRSAKADVIAYALEKSGITDKAKVIMVGDRHHDIDGAKQHGLASLGVLYGFGDRTELETAGADYIAETPEEIVEILL